MALLSPEERIRLAFELGEDDLDAFRRSRNLDRAEAVRQLLAGESTADLAETVAERLDELPPDARELWLRILAEG